MTASRVLPALLALLVCVVWLPSLNASFQFDDWSVVVHDARVQSVADWWRSMPGMRALLKLSYALNHEWSAGPAGFRAVNIALHAVNTVLVFTLLQKLARSTVRLDSMSALLAAATGALVFALHPVQTESVTYISGRSNVLMATFALLCVTAWLRRETSAHPLAWLLASLLALAAALAVKETAAVTPLALLLCGFSARGSRPAAVLRASLPHFALVLLALLASLEWTPYAALFSASLVQRAPWENLLVQADGVAWLVRQLLFLSPLNADPALPGGDGLAVGTVLRGAALVLLLLAGVLNLRRRPGLALGVLWFFLWLAPTNSLLARLDVANDRQLYVAIIGPGLLLGLALARVSDRLARRLPASDLGVIVVIAIGLSAGTLVRNRVYNSELGFWEDVAAKSPHNARAANNLGIAHALACQPLAARAEFERATRLDPQDPRAAINAQLLSRGELPDQPAVPECR